MKKVIILLVSFTSISLLAKEKAPGEESSSIKINQRVLANCAAPKASKEFWVNNVRTIIFTGGDMWWDRDGNTNAYYYIPAVQNRNNGISSSFAGSIWLGGLDAGGQLKVAAMTYRQNGIDFWPGPLDTINASADPTECSKYDQVYTVSRNEVDNFVAGGPITPGILNWPGNGDVSKQQGRRIAPFIDVNSDGLYDPTGGDYPAYDIQNLAEKNELGFCKTKLFGDNTLFWIFNDKGGIHTETQGVPIGVEVRAQAFGFKTNDEINNMTFYSYEVFNRSSFQLNSTYFTIWNDADLGYYLDDYVGCDVKRGLGYIYNADPFDESASGVNGYQDYPPSLGCDFFKGPLADIGDKIDNDQDGIIDEAGETIQMSRFTYYNNNIGAFPPQTTNPDIAIHYYNYMTGFWKDGSNFTIGGNAYGGTSPATYVYDGNPVKNTGWTEKASGNLPGDRRFLQSAGPFTLKPGAVNEITFGMPWAQSPSKGGNMQSLELLFSADDKAQALFDNCFKLLDGPEAPNLTIQEMNNELIFYLTNEKGKSNNFKRYNNDYEEEDISIVSDPTSTITALSNPDKNYRFEGYIVYQVKNDGVTSTDLSDRTKAIPIFQCDVANNYSRLVNYEIDNNVGGYVPKVKVDGANKGISSTFKITDDAFSTLENRKLVNNKTYYFVTVAYAHNEYLTYAPDVPVSISSSANLMGQKKPYLEGRKLKRAAGIPHNIDAEKGGTIAQSVYGFGPKITRKEGQGNGGNLMTLTNESELAILNSPNSFVENIEYEYGQGPINIKVVDPLNLVDSKFEFRFIQNSIDKKGQVPFVAKTPADSVNLMLKSAQSSSLSSKTYTGTLATINANNTSWELKDIISKKIYHPNEPTPSTIITNSSYKDTLFQAINVGNEFYFPELGFSIKINQVADPGEEVNKFSDFTTKDASYLGPNPGSFIGANISYVNGTNNWLGSLEDQDGENPFNWILSGSNKTAGFEDAYYKKTGSDFAFYDPQKQFGKILKGTWAPYPLCASYYRISSARIFCGPGFNGNSWKDDPRFVEKYNKQQDISSSPNNGNTDLRKMSSALIVFTKDQSKWTRCAVLEMQEKSQLSQGNAFFFGPRNHASVDKNGKIGNGIVTDDPNDADYISASGMGWFPGYAINIETGERLNMAFGEDSFQKENNGDDMIWNPTSSMNSPFQYAMGGKHFVYVFGGNTTNSKFNLTPGTIFEWETDLAGKEAYSGRYDYGKRIIEILQNYFKPSVFSTDMSGNNLAPFSALERDIMWVSIPMPKSGYNFLSPDNMPSDVRFQINVAKPYRYGFSGIANIQSGNQQYSTLNKLISVNNPSLLTTNIKASPENNNFPLYSFNTSDIATKTNDSETAKNALDLIRVVPNPYYGSSAYETGRVDNRVRITNLPNKCTIKIFSMNGTLIRTIKRDVSGQEDIYTGSNGTGSDIKQTKQISYTDWDLKNQNNISVASGLYIFYIDAEGLGEKIVKWFGIMRPLDVQSY